MERTHEGRPQSTLTARARYAFGVLFAAVYLVALAPPIYIALSGQHAIVAMVPVSVWYMLLISAAPIAVTYGLWVTERRYGGMD
ncbi:hypothetical protein GA0074694_4114 [Micromonospora inyonensis]|uniref:Solute:sodium symporter small subunit n=1 Tax=Micromonospora inyonensis TaxID=47866 RepID=A0A1C6S6D9_9ACTN|nr:hypothetical protein GA0074694_4114 [Micromonospora inyonensis]